MRGRPVNIAEDDLLDAARDEFLADGFAATTVNIAKRAGVSESILFYRYKTKEALLAAVVEREMRPPAILAQLEHTAGSAPVAENLETAGILILQNIRKSHPFMAIAQSSPSFPKVQEILHSHGASPERVVRYLSAYIEAEKKLCNLADIDAEIMARAFLGGVFDYVLSGMFRSVAADPQKDKVYLTGLIHILLNGAQSPGKSTNRRGQ